MEQLKSCPFCGGEGIIGSEVSWFNPAGKDEYYVACFNEYCDVQPRTIYMDTEKEAIEAWNRRADNDRQRKIGCCD